MTVRHVLSGYGSDVVRLCNILEGRLWFPGVLKVVLSGKTTSWNEPETRGSCTLLATPL